MGRRSLVGTGYLLRTLPTSIDYDYLHRDSSPLLVTPREVRGLEGSFTPTLLWRGFWCRNRSKKRIGEDEMECKNVQKRTLVKSWFFLRSLDLIPSGEDRSDWMWIDKSVGCPRRMKSRSEVQRNRDFLGLRRCDLKVLTLSVRNCVVCFEKSERNWRSESK